MQKATIRTDNATAAKLVRQLKRFTVVKKGTPGGTTNKITVTGKTFKDIAPLLEQKRKQCKKP